MKSKLLALLLMVLPSWSFAADCVLEKELRSQRLYSCRTPEMNKSLKVLDLQGGFKETAYYHGYFLRKEIERGVLQGVQIRTERAFAELDRKDRERLMLIKNCLIDNYRDSVSSEFKEGLKNLHRGMKDAGSQVPWKAFEQANYMTEASIFFDALERQLAVDPGQAKKQLLSSCAPHLVGHTLRKPFKVLARGLRSLKMGCTGISASAASSLDGALIHGRNFDTGLLGYYEGEQVAVINRQRNGITSVGLASAGLHYAGGISGFNNHGLAVSLHELQTSGTRMEYRSATSDIAPFLLHRALLNARTLDEAIQLLQDRKGFGAWTFFISDAKTDEVASIELSGDTVVVARRSKGKFLGQSNHFLATATRQEGYEYSLNKTLESRARLSHVTRSLAEDFGRIDAQWVIDRLSGHEDELVGPRSFGRTTTKVYTAATHVMVPARQEWWMSLPETYPTNRSHFIGFRLNAPGATSPLSILGRTRSAEDSSKSAWYDSMNYYVQTYLSNEADHKSLSGMGHSLALLEQAQRKSRESGIEEFTYHFMWARMKTARAARAIEAGQRALALSDLVAALERLQYLRDHQTNALHPYELFQTYLWSFRAETLKPQALMNKTQQHFFRTEAQRMLKGLVAQYPQQRELYELQWSLQQVTQLPIVLDADIRLGTVE